MSRAARRWSTPRPHRLPSIGAAGGALLSEPLQLTRTLATAAVKQTLSPTTGVMLKVRIPRHACAVVAARDAGWQLRPTVSDKQSMVIGGTVTAVLVFIMIATFVICHYRLRSRRDKNKLSRRSLWAGTQWKRGPRGKASFVPLADSSLSRGDGITSFLSLFLPGGKRRTRFAIDDMRKVSPYMYKESPRIAFSLLDHASSNQQGGSPLVRSSMQSAAYFRTQSSLTLFVNHDTEAKRRTSLRAYCDSPILATPEIAHPSPRLRTGEEMAEWISQGRHSDRRSPLLPSPWAYQRANDTTTPVEGREESAVFGLGIDISSSSTSNLFGEQRAFSRQSIAASRLASESPQSSGWYGSELIEKFNGPVYADKIANALIEAKVQLASSTPGCKEALLIGEPAIPEAREGLPAERKKGKKLYRTLTVVRRTERGSRIKCKPRAATDGVVKGTKCLTILTDHIRPTNMIGGSLICMSPESTPRDAVASHRGKLDPADGSSIHFATSSQQSNGSAAEKWGDPQRLFQDELSRPIPHSRLSLRTCRDEERMIEPVERRGLSEPIHRTSMHGTSVPTRAGCLGSSKIEHPRFSTLSRASPTGNHHDGINARSITSSPIRARAGRRGGSNCCAIASTAQTKFSSQLSWAELEESLPLFSKSSPVAPAMHRDALTTGRESTSLCTLPASSIHITRPFHTHQPSHSLHNSDQCSQRYSDYASPTLQMIPLYNRQSLTSEADEDTT